MFDASASSAVAVEPTVSSTRIFCLDIRHAAREFLTHNKGGLLGRYLCQHFRVYDYDCFHCQDNGPMLSRFTTLFAVDLIEPQTEVAAPAVKVVGYMDINSALREFYALGNSPLRVGQFLCNKFKIQDPDVFYLTDANKARDVFYKKYGGVLAA